MWIYLWLPEPPKADSVDQDIEPDIAPWTNDSPPALDPLYGIASPTRFHRAISAVRWNENRALFLLGH